VIDYKTAGVDLDAADDAKQRLKRLVESTFTPGVRGAFGGFGGLFRIPPGDKPRVLVSSIDGVGTKVKIAIEAGRHDTIGQDLVNHCVNDILVQGARPLFFLDYVAFGRLQPEVVEAVVAGVAKACRENECALVGGETAEMPGVYTPPDYDLAGCIVGIVDDDRVLGADRVRAGDVLLGLASTGLHTNGYSLARRVVSDRLHLAVTDPFPDSDRSVADVLLAVHQSYLPALGPVLDRIHAMAHVTGGGLPGNVDRALPRSLDARIVKGRWPVPRVFDVLARAGGIGEDEQYRAWNMGVGMVVIADPSSIDTIAASVRRAGVDSWPLGEIVPGEGRVQLM
jgi:phosphoribosylformylglycinamidine cyclo-ligase